jgi:hypothetical protein
MSERDDDAIFAMIAILSGVALLVLFGIFLGQL